METKQTIKIVNPSVALVAYIENVRQRKKERMKEMRDKFFNTKKM